MSKMSEELVARFRVPGARQNHTEAVIVTMAAGTHPGVLRDAGMRVEHVIRNQPLVSGTIDAVALEALCRLDEVILIEIDSEMHATGD